MKHIVLALALLVASAPWSQAALIIPGANGSDGALNITTNTEIDLSQAATAAWNANPTVPGKGVYDATQWAVVFKYSSVSIAAGATLTFKNHASRAPVVWLVSGDVTIAGTVSLDGQQGQAFPLLAEPGPGGFRGGMEYDSAAGKGGGFGPGGGRQDTGGGYAGGGSYSTPGRSRDNWNLPSPTYGNPSLVPLVGGSGGGAQNSRSSDRRGGGAGGGAILVAASGVVTVDGSIHSNGGAGFTGSGSGGGVRIVGSTLAGTGQVDARGGVGADVNWNTGGEGRIRLERVTNSNTIATVPSPSVVNLTDGATALLWPPNGQPKVEVISVGGNAAPTDPRAEFGTMGADVSIAQVANTPVVVRTTGVEAAAQVIVRVTPRTGSNYTETAATLTTTVSASPLVIDWTADVPVATGFSAVQVRVVRP